MKGFLVAVMGPRRMRIPVVKGFLVAVMGPRRMRIPVVKGFRIAVMGSVANVGAVAGSEDIVCRKVLHVGRLSRGG